MSEIKKQIVIQSTMSWLVTIQNFNLIAQSVLKLSHRENADDDDNNDDNDDDNDDNNDEVLVAAPKT